VPPSTILIVDDTPANLRLLAEMLSAQGYRVRPAPNGDRALATIRKELPDLILLDIMMPEMDGFEVCRRLKADEHARGVPVIFISALGDVFDKVTAFGVGGVDYVTKPFQLEEVLARVQTHLGLEAMRRALQEQNSELQAFASTVAHDLKNPVASMAASLGLLRMLLPAEQTPADAIEILEIAAQSAHTMNNIIDELLLLASVRQEQVPAGPVAMGAVAQQAWERLAHLRAQFNPTIVFPEAWPLALGYAPWLEEVWANYLSNALKYGGRPPHLTLGATPLPEGHIRFWVRDNGPGLDPESQAKLFTEFTRLNQTRARGHGLGLSIARRIVTKLGGQVGVESRVGEGSVFYFTLPKEK
jgi:signal transduction histidine kinase